MSVVDQMPTIIARTRDVSAMDSDYMFTHINRRSVHPYGLPTQIYVYIRVAYPHKYTCTSVWLTHTNIRSEHQYGH